MNCTRVVLAGLAATIVYFALGFLLFALSPLADEHGGSPISAGVRFGCLLGVFAVGSFVIHNYVNLNIGLRLTLGQAAAYLVQWIVAGIVIASIYRPSLK